ncbi:hypothetical protein [Paenibacillus illinoisensis]|uniref:hypothetical protein n=1 Tax=Paenibacillus illinoisensis TaxID=59845 RepID=UPI003017DCA7
MTANEILAIVRRRIGDTETPYTYADDLLLGYIGDAIDQVELEYQREVALNIIVDSITNVVSGEIIAPLELTRLDAQLFATKAHYLITLRTKGQADRDNFRMVKGRLTLDNTNQSDDHAETLRLIDLEYRRALYRVKNGNGSIKGVRME